MATTIDSLPLRDSASGPGRGSFSASATRGLTSWFGRFVLIAIVALWTVPTAGLAISSFRPENAIKTTPWWDNFTTKTIDAPQLNKKVVSFTVGDVTESRNGTNRVTLKAGAATSVVNIPPGTKLAVKVGDKIKSGQPVAANPRFTLRNYRDVLSSNSNGGQLGKYFWNSLKITLPATVLPILIAAFAAYAFSWMRFRGRDTLFLMTVALLVVPLQMAFIPLLRMINLGVHVGDTTIFPALTFMRNHVSSVWFAHTCFAMPLAIYLLRNFIGSLPGELMEAARVDGASHMKIFLRIVIPLSVPALASLGIFQFLWVWNDLAVATVFGPGQDVAPMTVKLVDLAGSKGEDWQRLTSGAFVTMLLPMTVFFALQKFFVRGLVTGSVKG